jgi:adenylate kinase family enzyme
MISDMIKHASSQQDELGELIKNTIEELKDAEVAAYEKTRKKKDPDLDRSKINVRLPEDILHKIVKCYLASPACMNKGFILDGYPRNIKDA